MNETHLILNILQAGISYLVNRGVQRDRIQTLIDSAIDGDLSTDQVQAELDATQAALDETGEMIDEMDES